MKYISSEEFLKQPKEVQKSLLDWWQPEVGDLFVNLAPNRKKKPIIIEDEGDCIDIELVKYEVVPLLIEGQLRQFIEDKTNLYIDTIHYSEHGYSVILNNSEWCESQFDNLGDNLLKAYWTVACEIANK